MKMILDILVPILTALLGSYFTSQYMKRKESRDHQKEKLEALRKVVSDVLPFITQAELLRWQEDEVGKIADKSTRNGYISTVARALTYFNNEEYKILHLALSTTLYLVMGVNPDDALAKGVYAHSIMRGTGWGKNEAEINGWLRRLEEEFEN